MKPEILIRNQILDIENSELLWWQMAVLMSKTDFSSLPQAQDVERKFRDCELKLRLRAASSNLVSNIDMLEYPASTLNFISALSDETEMLGLVGRSPSESVWLCPLCDSSESDPPEVFAVVCLQGHSWPRCVHTAQPVTSLSPSHCTHCNSSSSLKPKSNQTLLCSLCRGSMEVT